MKRISLMATVVAASVVAVCAIAAGSASAAVLCKSAPVNNICPASDIYPVGTEINAGVPYKQHASFETLGGSPIASCKNSTMAIELTSLSSGDMTEYSFSNCSSSVVSKEVEGLWGEAAFQLDEAGKGRLGTQTQVAITSPAFEGKTCDYSIFGPALVAEGNKIWYHEGTGGYSWGGAGCPTEIKVRAYYSITSPTSVYVAEE